MLPRSCPRACEASLPCVARLLTGHGPVVGLWLRGWGPLLSWELRICSNMILTIRNINALRRVRAQVSAAGLLPIPSLRDWLEPPRSLSQPTRDGKETLDWPTVGSFPKGNSYGLCSPASRQGEEQAFFLLNGLMAPVILIYRNVTEAQISAVWRNRWQRPA